MPTEHISSNIRLVEATTECFDFTTILLSDKFYYTTESTSDLKNRTDVVSKCLLGIPNPQEQIIWAAFDYEYSYKHNVLKIHTPRIYSNAYAAMNMYLYNYGKTTTGWFLYLDFLNLLAEDDRAVEFKVECTDDYFLHEGRYDIPYTLSDTSRDIIAESYGLPIPFTESNFLIFLLKGMNDGTINEIRSNRTILKRMTLMPFNVKFQP